MKKYALLFLVVFLCSICGAYSQSNNKSQILQLEINSQLLGVSKKYAIYLPASYATSDKEYPVLYLLHGAGNNEQTWEKQGNMKRITDKLIAEGMASEMIIVMPDAGSGTMGYFNMEGWPYEDYFFTELIPEVEKKFRIKAEKKYRAIAGLSMGGGGTVVYAQRHPEIFSSACALSGLLATFKGVQKEMRPERKKLYESAIKYAPLPFLENSTPETIQKLRTVRWYVDCGDDDYLYEGNIAFFCKMKELNIPLEYRMRNGGHNWEYWQSALPTVLQFISIGFGL